MPTNNPDTRIMINDSTPVKYISRVIRPKRLRLVPDFSNVSRKKRLA